MEGRKMKIEIKLGAHVASYDDGNEEASDYNAYDLLTHFYTLLAAHGFIIGPETLQDWAENPHEYS
jgi:hypothetical protein